jgi:N-sulfoglucosamine sulfohydrolase
MKYFTILCFYIVSLSVAPEIKGQQGVQPNILFILSDDHSAQFLGIYGNPDLKTPNIDKLGKDGIIFTKAFTTAPQCVPSRAALMTGRSQVEIGMTRFSAPLPADIKAYPEYLRKAGYYTGLCGRTFHLDGTKNTPESDSVFDRYKLETFKDRVDYLRKSDNLGDIHAQYAEFLNQVPKNKPFFLQLCFSDPHRIFDAKTFEPDPKKIKVPAAFPDTKLLREDLAGYYGEIQRLDASIGKVLEELEKRGLNKNTLVVFMGDNGGALIRGKGTLHTLGIHVPLIARYPGTIHAGQTSNALISGIDLAPTFLSIAGLPIPPEITGKSFLPALQGKAFQGHEYVFAARSAHGSGLPTTTDLFDLGRTVFNSKYKLIYNALWQLPYTPVDFKQLPFWIDLQQLHKDGRLEPKWSKLLFAEQRPLFELYDLEKDIEEFDNLSERPEYAVIENNLKAQLQEWMILNKDYLPLPVSVIPK